MLPNVLFCIAYSIIIYWNAWLFFFYNLILQGIISWTNQGIAIFGCTLLYDIELGLRALNIFRILLSKIVLWWWVTLLILTLIKIYLIHFTICYSRLLIRCMYHWWKLGISVWTLVWITLRLLKMLVRIIMLSCSPFVKEMRLNIWLFRFQFVRLLFLLILLNKISYLKLVIRLKMKQPNYILYKVRFNLVIYIVIHWHLGTRIYLNQPKYFSLLRITMVWADCLS